MCFLTQGGKLLLVKSEQQLMEELSAQEEVNQRWSTLRSSACPRLHHRFSFRSLKDEARRRGACFPHLLHLRQAVQQADSVL